MKKKTTINLTQFSEWDPHSTNCQICNKVKLLQKWIIGTQKLKLQKITLGRTKANTNIWTQSALENLNQITQPDSLPAKLTLKDFAPDINPHLHFHLSLIHKKVCSLSLAEQCQSISVIDIFYLTEECKISRLVEDATLHVIRTKMSMSPLPNKSTEFKTKGPRVSAIY